MTRGHFLAFLLQACGILQKSASKYVPYPIRFSVLLFPLPPLAKVKKEETNACLLPPLCSNQTEFPANFFFNPGPKVDFVARLLAGAHFRARACISPESPNLENTRSLVPKRL